jgi:hypothetical protein
MEFGEFYPPLPLILRKQSKLRCIAAPPRVLEGVWDGSGFQLQCGAVVCNINLNSIKIFVI